MIIIEAFKNEFPKEVTMKKIFTFIPLGVGISSAIIYVFNVLQFRVINSSVTLLQILSNLKVYLYVSIAGFLVYFLIKLFDVLSVRKNSDSKEETSLDTDEFEPFEPVTNNEQNEANNFAIEEKDADIKKLYVPNYDYVPMYQENQKKIDEMEYDTKVTESNPVTASEEIPEEKVTLTRNSYCYNCGENIYSSDSYCSSCGAYQGKRKNKINPVLKSIINLLEIVILILIIYFSLNMLFDYKESRDPNFTSPFKVSMTK